MNRKSWFGKTVLALGLLALVCGPALAQPGGRGQGGPGGRGGFGGPGGGFGGGQTDLVTLLNNEDVRRELEVVGPQMRDVEALRESTRERMRDALGDLRDASPEERREKMAAVRDDITKELKSILLPHQMERLEQISVQMQMRGQGGLVRALTVGPLADELGLSEEVRAELREKSRSVQEGLREKISSLQEEANEEILSVLPSDKRDELKKKMGEPFEMTLPAPGTRGGPGAGPGGRGGARGEGTPQRRGGGEGRGQGRRGGRGDASADRGSI